MLPSHDDPIVAIATASGRGGVGIVRLSGNNLGAYVAGLLGRALEPRHATYLTFPDATGEAIDRGLALWFPAPHSYTGEDVLELQAHGGPVVLQLLLARCLEVAASAPAGRSAGVSPLLPELRLARPGEFTERAYLNDKLDLAQAEAVADLIDASTEAAARSAGRSLSGAFSREIEGLRDQLVDLRMLVEATLDFPEEELDFLEKAGARARLEAVAKQVDVVLSQARQGVLLRDGMDVVIAGQPNVGKSSLLNALAGAELAIVTPIAGTTRDKVSATIQIEGVPVRVTDTAGLRGAGADEIERIGIERSWQAIERADAVLFIHDLSRGAQPAYEAAEAEIAAGLPASLDADGRLLHVFNKLDVVSPLAESAPAVVSASGIGVSALTGEGIVGLRRQLLRLAGWHAQPEGAFIARTRHVEALRRTGGHLVEARSLAAQADAALDLLAEELRLAHDALGEITGAFSADDLLGEIFGRFCIGK